MLQFRLLSLLLVLVTIAALPVRSQMLIRLDENGDHTITLYQGETRIDTVFIGGPAYITGMSYPKKAPLVFQPFSAYSKTPFTLGADWIPVGVLITTGSARESFVIGYNGRNGPTYVQYDVHASAYAKGSDCLKTDSVEKIDSVKLYEYRSVSFDIANGTTREVTLDSLRLQSATPDFFRLQLSSSFPALLYENGVVPTTVGFWTQGLSVAPALYTATLTAYPRGCRPDTTQIRVTTHSVDTTYNPYYTTIYFIGSALPIVRRIIVQNLHDPSILRKPYIVGNPAFSIVGMSFPIDTIIREKAAIDSVFIDSVGNSHTIHTAGYRDTILGHVIKTDETAWVDVRFAGNDTLGVKQDSIAFAKLVVDSIGEVPRTLIGMFTGMASSVASTAAAPTPELIVTYDGSGRPNVRPPLSLPGTLTIFDLLGRELRQYPPAPSWILTDLPAGHYIVRFTGVDAVGKPSVASAKVVVGR
jgi:hypothetical protein